MNQRQVPLKFSELSDEALIRVKQLLQMQLVPYSATTLWRKCRTNEFPRPLKISAGVTAWRVGDIRKHLAQIGVIKDGNA
jgi:predicted DNA-binding transcriptional regulator AlpA